MTFPATLGPWKRPGATDEQSTRLFSFGATGPDPPVAVGVRPPHVELRLCGRHPQLPSEHREAPGLTPTRICGAGSSGTARSRSARPPSEQEVRAWLDRGVDPATIAVLARTRPHGLHRLRIAAEAADIPFTWPLPSEDRVPLSRIQEIVRLVAFLDRGEDRIASGDIEARLDDMGASPWVESLRRWLAPNLGRKLPREAWRYERADDP